MGVRMVSFNLRDTEFSIEEAVAIEGFMGYVHCIKGDHTLGHIPVVFDDKDRPLQIVALVFTRPQGG